MRAPKTCMPVLLMAAFLVVPAYGGPIPDTGQSECYDNDKVIACPQPGEPFYGQNAQYSTTPLSYTKIGSKGQKLPDSATSWAMVRDNVTGLTWEVKNSKDGVEDYSNLQDADNIYTWYDSNPSSNRGDAGTSGDGTDTEDFIRDLNSERFGGFSDWRMPTSMELSVIFNRATDSPAANDTSFFPNTLDHYWTSTTDPTTDHPERAASVDFSTGWMNFPDKSDSQHVRAVRGEQLTQNFIDNADGTVTDASTGLMWQQDSSPKIMWEDALSYCENLTLAGYDDWRMPDINELLSVADYSLDSPSIDTDFFPMTFVYYWSSTTTAYSPGEAFQVCFVLRGRLETKSKLNLSVSYVRAVRGGLNETSGEGSGETCPAVFLLGDKEPGLDRIRQFRDEVLAGSSAGRKMINFYYQNSKKITDVLEQNPLIKKAAKAILDALIHAMEFVK